MKISLSALLVLLLFFSGNKVSSKTNTVSRCGPTIYMQAIPPYSWGTSTSITKVTVLNTGTGALTTYNNPTGSWIFPQDGGFNYVITYYFSRSVPGVLTFAAFSGSNCKNVSFNASSASITYQTLCTDYWVYLDDPGVFQICPNP